MTRVRSWAGTGVLVQIALVYVVTGLKKTDPEWFDGTAVWYALSMEEYVTALGRWVRMQPALIAPLSYGVKWVEIFGPLLVFSPWRNTATRLIAFGLFWTLHLGLEICQAIGIFQLVGLAAWLAVLPSAVWDRRTTAPSTDGGSLRNARWAEWLALVPLAYLAIVLALVGSGAAVGRPHHPVPRAVDRIAVPLHIQEGWAMFTDLSGSNPWFMAPGRLTNGEEIEVLRRGPLDWRKPPDVQSTLRGFRWTMYFFNVIGRRGAGEWESEATRWALLDYLCREWNAENPPARRLESVSLVMVIGPMPRPGSPPPPSEPVVLGRRICGPGI